MDCVDSSEIDAVPALLLELIKSESFGVVGGGVSGVKIKVVEILLHKFEPVVFMLSFGGFFGNTSFENILYCVKYELSLLRSHFHRMRESNNIPCCSYPI